MMYRPECGHNSYWTTAYSSCMACRAEKAEADSAAKRQRIAQLEATVSTLTRRDVEHQQRADNWQHCFQEFRDLANGRERKYEQIHAVALKDKLAQLEAEVVAKDEQLSLILALYDQQLIPAKELHDLHQNIEQLKEFIGVTLDKQTQTYVSGKPPYLSAGRTETEAMIAAVDALRMAADVLAEKNQQLEAEVARLNKVMDPIDQECCQLQEKWKAEAQWAAVTIVDISNNDKDLERAQRILNDL